jgi:tRNA(His) guanylyltransferase
MWTIVVDSIGDRMKRYEIVTQNVLTRRMPVIVRIDGKAFHTFTKGIDKPFDETLASAMIATTRALVDGIQGARIGYTQSDEISIFCHDWAKLETPAWFDYNVQKVVSVSASIATVAFNNTYSSLRPDNGKCALFDARVFNIPQEEVANYFIWRQQDATRNSIMGLAQANFSHEELQGLKVSQLQDKLMLEKQINWNDVATKFKRGWCVNTSLVAGTTYRAAHIDDQIPVFTTSRHYIEDHL